MKRLYISIILLALNLNLFAQMDSLNINNINARFFTDGVMFYGGDGEHHFEVPNGSGKKTIFSSAFWIGGLDANGQLHLTADRFRQDGIEWFPGPLANSGQCDTANYNRIWKINRSSVDSFNTWYQNPSNWPGYSPPQDIVDFPALGDVNQGFSSYFFPFSDYTYDSWYSAQDGDAPIIRGDQSLFYIFNDNCGVSSSNSPLGIEIRATAYAFNCPEDSALFNTIFLHYDIVNMTNTTYFDTWLGLWSDLDIGDATDDFIACDVMRGAYYGYNGTSIDGSGGPGEYGAHPPAQAIVFLGGPYQDNDGIDNGYGIGAGESLNGLGFGDGIADNERLGMGRFMYHNNAQGAQGDPQTPQEHYNYLRGLWRDGTPMQFGGHGHINNCTSCEPAHYMYPGDSDQEYYWGTSGNPVAVWSELTAANTPADRRGLGSVGPFTLAPGDVEPLDIAFVFGRDYHGGAAESIEVMKDRIDAIREMFIKDSVPGSCGGSFTSIRKIEREENTLQVYPNPVSDILYVDLKNTYPASTEFSIIDFTGRLVDKGMINKNINTINLSSLRSGVYLLRIANKNEVVVKRFIKN